MEQIKPFNDIRLNASCSYCEKNTGETKDHVPSKVLLDEPFPENLSVVPCCLECNQSFSIDEEYFACSIECIKCGTSDINHLKRDKIKSILEKKTILRERLKNSFIIQNGKSYFKYEKNRFSSVVLKLARGHVKYELSNSQINEPTSISIKPLNLLSAVEFDHFFKPVEIILWPEVGSRTMQNIAKSTISNITSKWIEVQKENYKYCVIENFETIIVKIVIGNYLAIEVIWED